MKDRLTTIDKLISKKIMPKQAEAIALEIEELERKLMSKCATKEVVENAAYKVNISIDHKISTLKSELLKWFIGISLAQTASFISTLIAAMQ